MVANRAAESSASDRSLGSMVRSPPLPNDVDHLLFLYISQGPR